MPIIDLQRRMREIGRIRTGHQVPGSNGRKRPDKLEHFRLTSPSQALVEAAAEVYGGSARRWQDQWEVITEAAILPILIPPSTTVSQYYELWTGGGCVRRCDGETNVIDDSPCSCPVDPGEKRELAKDGRACKPTTRLNVMLPDLPDLGVWRLESHGYYAAVELAGTVDVLANAERTIPATLRLDQREVKRPNKPTNRFAVPVIELNVRIGELVGLAGGSVSPAIPGRTDRRERVPRPALPPGPRPPTETQFRHGGAEDGGTPPGSPSAPPPDPAPFAPPPDVTDDGEVLAVDDPAPFLDRLRAVADANGGQASVASRDQKREVHELLEGLGTDAVVAVLLEALDRAEFAAITTGEAQAVLEVAASMGRDAFRDAWASAAIAVAIDDESGMGGVRE